MSAQIKQQVSEPFHKEVLSITEAAKAHGITRQAIYVAIKYKKLKACKESARWEINLKDLEEYRSQKYSRQKSLFNGELLFDKSKGLHSIKETANLLKVPVQQIYYATRVGLLKATRKGAAWVIHTSEIKAYQENYLNKKDAESQAI
jgi:predicted DNA-binding protein YlxM (UPF0122 family)